MAEILKVKDVMEAYLASSGLTHEKFADAITESLVNTNVSRVAVTNWTNDKSEPNTDFLLICLVAYSDWRRVWALDCLKVKLPEVFDSGVIKFKLPLVS
jgi:hypothetical protein